MTKLRTIIIVLLMVALLSPSTLLAGWADDWMANASIQKPGYYSSQGGGYVSAGGFRARWKSTADYPLSVTPPKIKMGCGGIDIFNGGYHFLDTDWLVQKLQQILQNAPAVALDLALNVLCTQCSKAMKEFESKMTALNNLQLDSCKASQAIVAKGMQEMGSDKEELGNIVADYEVSSGTKSLFSASAQDTSSAKGVASPTSVNGALSGCDAEFKMIFMDRANSTGQSTILQNIASRIGLDDTYWMFMAGMVGDVGINRDSNSSFTSFPIEPCAENKNITFSTLINDSIYLRDPASSTGKCVAGSDVDYVTQVKTMLTSIAGKMETRTALSSSETDFLNYANGATYPLLKYGVQSNSKSTTIEDLAPIIAQDITLHMMTDLYTKVEELIAKVQSTAAKKSSAGSSNDPSECAATLFSGALKHIEAMSARIAPLRRELNENYQRNMNQLAQSTQNIESLQKNHDRLSASIANKLGYNVLNSVNK